MNLTADESVDEVVVDRLRQAWYASDRETWTMMLRESLDTVQAKNLV